MELRKDRPPLRQYQEETVETLVSARAVYAALEPGLGKTRIAIEVAIREGAMNVLVFCPASVRSVWRQEIEKWETRRHWVNVVGKVLPRQVDRVLVRWTVVNYDRVSRGGDVLDALKALGPFDLVVCDEAHFLKNPSAARTRAVLGAIAPRAKRVLPLSGTPMPNHAGELYAIVRSLAPQAVANTRGEAMTMRQWEDRYCDIDQRWIGGRQVRVIKGSRNIADLKERLSGFFVRKTKAECLPELPPLQFETIEMSPGPTALREIRDEMVDVPAHISDDDLLRLLNSDTEHFARALRLIGLAKASAIVPYLAEFLADNDRKVIVMAQHRDVIDYLMRTLQALGPVKIDGRDNAAARDLAIHAFLNDPSRRIFVGQIKACGTGITLLSDTVAPTDVFFVESSFAPADNVQAASRSHRIGQKNGVLARVIVAEGVPLDQRVQDIITRKTKEIAELI